MAQTHTTFAKAAALLAALVLGAGPAGAQPRGPQPYPAPASAIPREHAEVVQSYGGLYQGRVAAYVSDVGARVAAAGGRPGQCAFHVLNTEVVNAFTTPPGCHVYVTRGLLALIGSEDELAAVLGHELGHVTANHAGRRQQRSVLTGIGALVLGALTRSGDVAQIASQVGQLNVLSYSRAQEFEADDIAVRTLAQAGYSPFGLVDLLSALQREDQFEDARRGREATQQTAAWARTHPLTGDRISRAVRAAQATGLPPAPPQLQAKSREVYLRAIDGLPYGDDPEQGVVDGQRFVHPRMRIGFEAPPRFVVTNGERAVTIEGQGGFSGQFSAGAAPQGLEAYAQQVAASVIGQAPAQFGRPERTRIGGFDAVVLGAQAQSSSRGVVDVTVAAYADGPAAYHFVLLSPAGREEVWDPMIGSFHRLSPAEAAQARSREISLASVRAGDTVESLSTRMAYGADRLERFLLLNALRPGDRLTPGRLVKIVTYARR